MHQCFSCCWAVSRPSVSHSVHCLQLAGVSNRLGGDTSGTADPDWPQWCEWPCNVRPSSKIWVVSDCFCITWVGVFPLVLLDCWPMKFFFLAFGLPILSLERSALRADQCLSCWPDLTPLQIVSHRTFLTRLTTLSLLIKALLSSRLLA